MLRLVEDLLDAARISEGKVCLRSDRVDLRSVVKDAIEVVDPSVRGQASDDLIECTGLRSVGEC